MRLLFLAVLVLFAGCATARHTEPYTVERAVGAWNADWFGDREPTTLIVRNPLEFLVRVIVGCLSNDAQAEDGRAYWETDVPALDEVIAFMQKLNRDQFVDICSVAKWAPVPADRYRGRLRTWHRVTKPLELMEWK